MQIAQLLQQTETQTERERTYIFFTTQTPSIDAQTQLQNAIFFAFKYFYVYFFSLSPSLSFSSFLNFAHFERKHIRTCALLHTHTKTHVAVFLTLTLSLSRSAIWNSHSASDSNESASTNAQLTDFVAMLQLLLVLEIDGNDKWRQRDVATTATHRQLTRQSHTAAQQAAQAWNIKRGSFAVAATNAAAVDVRVVTNTCIRAHKHACMMNESYACVCVCVQWGFYWWVFRCGKFHK